MNNKTKWIIFVIFSAIFFASYWVFSKLLFEDFWVFYHWAIKWLMIMFFILPILIYKKEIVKIKKEDFKWLSVFLIAMASTSAPIYFAYNYLWVWEGNLLFFISMLLTMYWFWSLFLKEKLTKIKIFSLFLAILGMLIIFPFDFKNIIFIAWASMIFAWFVSWIECASSKKITNNYSALYVSFLWWIGIFIVNIILAIVMWEELVVFEFNLAWIYLFLYAFVSFLWFWFLLEWLKYIEASLWWLIWLLEIILAIIFWILFFNESLSLNIFIWWILILISAWLPNLLDYLNRKKLKYKKN